MLSSKDIAILTPLIEIVKNAKEKTIGKIKQELNLEREI